MSSDNQEVSSSASCSDGRKFFTEKMVIDYCLPGYILYNKMKRGMSPRKFIMEELMKFECKHKDHEYGGGFERKHAFSVIACALELYSEHFRGYKPNVVFYMDNFAKPDMTLDLEQNVEVNYAAAKHDLETIGGGKKFREIEEMGENAAPSAGTWEELKTSEVEIKEAIRKNLEQMRTEIEAVIAIHARNEKDRVETAEKCAKTKLELIEKYRVSDERPDASAIGEWEKARVAREQYLEEFDERINEIMNAADNGSTSSEILPPESWEKEVALDAWIKEQEEAGLKGYTEKKPREYNEEFLGKCIERIVPFWLFHEDEADRTSLIPLGETISIGCVDQDLQIGKFMNRKGELSDCHTAVYSVSLVCRRNEVLCFLSGRTSKGVKDLPVERVEMRCRTGVCLRLLVVLEFNGKDALKECYGALDADLYDDPEFHKAMGYYLKEMAVKKCRKMFPDAIYKVDEW